MSEGRFPKSEWQTLNVESALGVLKHRSQIRSIPHEHASAPNGFRSILNFTEIFFKASSMLIMWTSISYNNL